MASVKDFEDALKEVVNAKRLSESKMNRMTEAAMKSMENDTQLVSVLYRTHKGLSADKKIHGLYAFNALATAARHKVHKHNIIGDLNAEKGNCATFLLRVEGVLDGLVKDMVATGNPECKEKTKKVLDIWTKSNIFPSAVLKRLAEIMKESSKEPTVNSPPPGDAQNAPIAAAPPRPTSATSPGAPPSITPGADPQSTLLALLSAATAMGGPSFSLPGVGSPGAPQLDATQMALLQHLQKTAAQPPAVPTPPVPSLVPPYPPHLAHPLVPTRGPGPVPGPRQPPFIPPPGQQLPPPLGGRPDIGPPRREAHFDGPGYFDGSGRGRGRDDHYDERRDYRNGPPRGGFAGPARGRGRWDERGPRFRERDPGAAPYRRRSRSRSPPRNRYGSGGGARDMAPAGPPRVVPTFQQPTEAPSANGQRPSPAPAPGKDEFGRDLRPDSPVSVRSPVSAHGSAASARSPPPSASASVVSAASNIAVASQPAPQPIPVVPVLSSEALAGPSAKVGLEAFDYATFDPTAPASWDALGRAWLASRGYAPSQEELMQFVMSGGMAPGQGAVSTHAHQSGPGFGVQQQQQAASEWKGVRGGGGGRGRGRGRGYGYGVGNGREDEVPYDQYGGGFGAGSDAIVLGGEPMEEEGAQMGGDEEGGVRGGRMQKVGDGWLFVRESDQASVA